MFKKFLAIFSIFLIALILLTGFFWLDTVPKIIKNKKFESSVINLVKKNLDMDLSYKNPTLKTYLNPRIDFKIDYLTLKKQNLTLINLQDFNMSVSFNQIFNKKIKLNWLIAQDLTLKADKLLEALPNNNQTQTGSFDYKLDLHKSNIGLTKMYLTYIQNKALLEITGNNVYLDDKENYKALNFKSNIKLKDKNTTYVDITANSKGEIKLYKDYIKIDDFNVLINKSKVTINSLIDYKNQTINAVSNTFYLEDVFDIINSNFIIPDGKTLISPLINPSGVVSFDVTYKNGDLDGFIDLINTGAQLKDLTKIPLNIQKGKIIITKNKIDFKDLKGYWGKNKNNTLEIFGDIKDYYKTFDSNIQINTVVSNEFLHNYLEPLIKVKLYISKPSKTAIVYKAKNGIMDITWYGLIKKGTDFGVDENKSALSDYDRAVKGDFHIENEKIEIRNINYYIASTIKKGVKITPIIIVDGLTDFEGKLYNIGFTFGREMPSEFLNIFTSKGMFKKGTIKGDLHVEFKNDIPYLNADMILKDTFIPSQRLKINTAEIKTTPETIHLNMDGKFKKVQYKFNGNIKNGLIAPYTIKNLKLEIDEIDVERFLASLNNQQDNQQDTAKEIEEDTDDDFMFDTNLVRIEDCNFILHKGNYKDLDFGNIDAHLTLDKNGILNIKSNKFDIAKGTSSLKVTSDLKNLKHNIILGVKDIDSSLMAKVLFNLEKEIAGLASGIINLNTDKDLKLNGDIKFIVKDGTIGKIGLVEYILKIASLFRNPIVMINPTTIMDIVSIPEGKFEKITGKLQIKNNVINNMFIQSYSNSLSALIRGRFDFEKHDASLRIYTRFSSDKKTMFNFLRNISLNALANKVQLNTRNDANYYSSELVDLPSIDVDDSKTQIFLTTVEGDVEHNNFLSALKKIK